MLGWGAMGGCCYKRGEWLLTIACQDVVGLGVDGVQGVGGIGVFYGIDHYGCHLLSVVDPGAVAVMDYALALETCASGTIVPIDGGELIFSSGFADILEPVETVALLGAVRTVAGSHLAEVDGVAIVHIFSF